MSFDFQEGHTVPDFGEKISSRIMQISLQNHLVNGHTRMCVFVCVDPGGWMGGCVTEIAMGP